MSMLLIPYLIAISILTITPGLDTTLIIRTATLEGKMKAFQAALGINLGCIVWGVIVACGLGALLMTSDLAFNALKWIGAIYLTWLGLNLLLKPRSQLASLNNSAVTRQNWFMKGFWGNLLNPKVGIFLYFLFATVYSTVCISSNLDHESCDDTCRNRIDLVNFSNCCDAVHFHLFKAT